MPPKRRRGCRGGSAHTARRHLEALRKAFQEGQTSTPKEQAGMGSGQSETTGSDTGDGQMSLKTPSLSAVKEEPDDRELQIVGAAVAAAAAEAAHPEQRPPFERPAPANGKLILDYNPFDTREWNTEVVDRNSVQYQESLRRVHSLFPIWLRSVAVFGERCLRDVNTAVDRRALVDVAHQFGYDSVHSRNSTCRFVYVKSVHRIYMRSGPRNPFLAAEMAKDLSRMEIETRRLAAQREGRPEPLNPVSEEKGGSRVRVSQRTGAVVAYWSFTDLLVHRNVVQILRMMAYDMGVFRGRPSLAGDELSARYNVSRTVLDLLYMYSVEVSLSVDAHWEEEVDYLTRRPGKDGGKGVVPFSAEDPYPGSEAVRNSASAVRHYREYIRPFLYDNNIENTRCPTDLKMEADLKPPALAPQLGSAFSLRWDKDEQNNVFMRRWLRHSLQIFTDFLPAFKRQDEQNVSEVMCELQRRHPELDPLELLTKAKEETPHFGMLNLCLEFSHFRRELGELQSYAAKTESTIYMWQEGTNVFMAATTRDLPRLPPAKFNLLFKPTGGFAGPSYLGLKDVNTAKGESNALSPSMLHLINRFTTSAAGPGPGPGPGAVAAVEGRRRRPRSEPRSDGVSEASGMGGRGVPQGHGGQINPRDPHPHAGAPNNSSPRPWEGGPVGHAPAPVAAYTPAAAGYAPCPPMAMPTAAAPSSYAYAPQPYNVMPQPAPVARRSRYVYPPALPASSLYDVIMGNSQRLYPPGQTAELHVVNWPAMSAVAGAPAGLGFMMDHLKREAFVASAPLQ